MVAEGDVRPKILVIDDEVGARESLRILLKNVYDVLLAESVDKGVSLLRTEKPDVVVMDIRMPGKSGIEGLKEIREIDASISVVMLTGFGALETAQQAMRLGANDYLKKPFDTREMMGIIHENLERTQLERRRVNVAVELQNLNADLVSELTVKEHMATLGHASSEFVHDLRNPLTVVHGYAQLLEDELETLKEKMGDDMEATLEYLEIISRNVKRCCDLTETWRNLGKVSEANRKQVKMSDIVDDVISGIEPLAVGGRIDLTCVIEDRDAEIVVDPMLIFRALQNLVTNALHSVTADQNGKVRVSCRRVDQEIMVGVEDNGCGIPADQLEKIFEPYYTTKDVQSGTGLGLTITRKVMDNHGGRIEVQSEEGSGTTFRVYIPVA